jgi:hypothetical protein
MTPAHMSAVFTAGASMAFENGNGPLGAVLAAMAEQCRKINAADNPAYVESPPDASTIAMPALADASRGRIMPVPLAASGDGFALAIPLGWRLVQVMPEITPSAEPYKTNHVMCVMVPDA